MHPDFPGWNNIGNDVCLLKVPSLSSAAPASCTAGGTNRCFASACLPAEDFSHGEACWVTGWGATSWDGDVADYLQSVGVNLFSKEYCDEFSKADFPEGIMHDVEICAGIPDNDKNGLMDMGKDGCSGDSGGPLTCVRNGQPVVVGLVSWGWECANEGEPGIYTNVFRFVDWIEETIANSTDPQPSTTSTQIWTTTSTTNPQPSTTSTPKWTTTSTTSPQPSTTSTLVWTTTSTLPGPEPEFDETSDQIPSGLQCTTGFPTTSNNAKIVGGVITEEGTYPWQVRLNLDSALCGGSIIHDRWILTAAHCCEDRVNADVFVGDWNKFGNDEGEFSVQESGSQCNIVYMFLFFHMQML